MNMTWFGMVQDLSLLRSLSMLGHFVGNASNKVAYLEKSSPKLFHYCHFSQIIMMYLNWHDIIGYVFGWYMASIYQYHFPWLRHTWVDSNNASNSCHVSGSKDKPMCHLTSTFYLSPIVIILCDLLSCLKLKLHISSWKIWHEMTWHSYGQCMTSIYQCHFLWLGHTYMDITLSRNATRVAFQSVSLSQGNCT